MPKYAENDTYVEEFNLSSNFVPSLNACSIVRKLSYHQTQWQRSCEDIVYNIETETKSEGPGNCIERGWNILFRSCANQKIICTLKSLPKDNWIAAVWCK